MKRFFYLLLIGLCLNTMSVHAQLIAVKTDALMDCMLTPNLNAELVLGEKSSINASVFGNYKPWGVDMKMLGLMPEFRFWFNGRPMTREFVGIALIGVNYDITWDNEIYDGNAMGIGVTFGYSFHLSRRWNLECYAGLGAIYYDQKHYYTKDNPALVGTSHNSYGYTLLPFKLGVSFCYIIK